jgi:hypothetical protein
MEASEKIIVFQAFDTVMQANLAKTKLDAYGIPCFLTEENFTALYPLRKGIFPDGWPQNNTSSCHWVKPQATLRCNACSHYLSSSPACKVD